MKDKGKITLKNGQQIKVTTVIKHGASRLPKMRDAKGNAVDHEKHLLDCYLAGVHETKTTQGGVNRINWYIKKVVRQHNKSIRKTRRNIFFKSFKKTPAKTTWTWIKSMFKWKRPALLSLGEIQ